MTSGDIRGSFEAPFGSSRGAPASARSSWPAGQDRGSDREVVSWTSEFLPAIRTDTPHDGVARDARWYVLRYVTQGERTLRRILDLVGMEHHLFTLEKKQPRAKPLVLPWLPAGYMFVRFDADVDRWQQVRRMPHALEILGMTRGTGVPSPLPADGEGSFEWLQSECPRKLPKNDPHAVILVGTEILWTVGRWGLVRGRVTESDDKGGKAVVMLFGRPSPVLFTNGTVEIVG